MKLPSQQRGMGMWGWVSVLGIIGLTSTIAMKAAPLYLNEMSIEKIVSSVAQSPLNASLPVTEIRRTLSKRWIVDNVTALKVEDVKVVKDKNGRAMMYDYEARAELFEDIYLVLHFHKKFPMKAGGAD